MEKEKAKKGKISRSQYHMGQNTWFMIKLAWNSGEKKVLVLGLLSAMLAVASNLVQLYVSPALLSAVERHVPAAELIMTILRFVLGMMLISAASAYVKANVLYGRISVRREIVNLLNQKAATTSYSNVDDDSFRNLLIRANESTGSNDRAAEAVWTTLTTLTANLLGFVIYVSLLTAVKPFLILIILMTTAAGYLISNYLNGYGYRHREEEAEYERQMRYIFDCTKDAGMAKDIRIFGLRPWLEELYDKSMGAYTAFHKKAQGGLCLGKNRRSHPDLSAKRRGICISHWSCGPKWHERGPVPFDFHRGRRFY